MRTDTQSHHEHIRRSALPTLLAALVVLTLVPGASVIAPATAALAVEATLREPAARHEAAPKQTRCAKVQPFAQPEHRSSGVRTDRLSCTPSRRAGRATGECGEPHAMARRGLIAMPPPMA